MPPHGQHGSPPPTPPLDARGLPVGYPLRPEWEVTPRQTRDAMSGSGEHPLLIDCRRDDEVRLCRIEGSLHIPMDQIPQRLDEINDARGRPDRPIIVYCHHGMRSMRVTSTLRGLGVTNVMSMAGGIDLWSIDIQPELQRY